MLSDNDTPVQPQLERSERRTQWVRLHKNYAEVEILWAMTKAVELLRKDFYRKGVCAIADIVKTRQEKTDNKRGIGNRGKTKIVVKEHFSEKGKTMEELLTDVMLEKAKQTIA